MVSETTSAKLKQGYELDSGRKKTALAAFSKDCQPSKPAGQGSLNHPTPFQILTVSF